MKSSKILLQHILSAITNIEHFTAESTQADFLTNFMMQHAVTRNIEVIGEASKNIDGELKKKFPSIS